MQGVVIQTAPICSADAGWRALLCLLYYCVQFCIFSIDRHTEKMGLLFLNVVKLVLKL